MDRRPKQPNEELDFDFDAIRKMTPDEVLTGATATYVGADTALNIYKVEWADTYAKVWVKGGTNYATYKITAIMTTSGGRTLEKEMLLVVRDQ